MTLSSCWRIKMALGRFNSVFGNDIVSTIKPADLENYQGMRRQEGKADATIDQEIGAAKTMINKAFDNHKVSGETLKSFKIVKKLLKDNSNARDKILTIEEVERLIDCAPLHIKPIIATGFYAGMRKSEILKLKWGKVDLKKRVIKLDTEDTKDKEARIIPIIDELYEFLKAIPRNIHNDHVFFYKARPIKDIRTGLKDACKGSDILYAVL